MGSVIRLMGDAQGNISRLVDRRMALAREWDDLVRQVRDLDGFEDFLKPPRLGKLLSAAVDGPVAVINISQWRCDALLVTSAGVQVKKLPRVSEQIVTERTVDYLRALTGVDYAARELHAAWQRYSDGDYGLEAVRLYTEAKAVFQDAECARDEKLSAVLAWLWDDIADPILTALNFDGALDADLSLPRLWWCPTGLLTLLPLHAAGYYDESDQSCVQSVMDRAVSSYTPTLRALVQARRPLDLVTPDRILVVTVPDADVALPLGDVVRERQLLASLFGGQSTVLDSEAATWEAVSRELLRHGWVHFSCHGGQDLVDPSQGGLLLHDRVLKVADISAGHYRGEFAFLSACMTATGGIALPDEAITLAAALHYTGYRHVIGTLWSVYDEIAADIAELVYRDLISSGQFRPSRAAYALHNAIRNLRDSGRFSPHAWAPFTHTGP